MRVKIAPRENQFKNVQILIDFKVGRLNIHLYTCLQKDSIFSFTAHAKFYFQKNEFLTIDITLMMKMMMTMIFFSRVYDSLILSLLLWFSFP